MVLHVHRACNSAWFYSMDETEAKNRKSVHKIIIFLPLYLVLALCFCSTHPCHEILRVRNAAFMVSIKIWGSHHHKALL